MQNMTKHTRACAFTCIEWFIGWLVVLRIYVALAIFQPYRDLEAGDNQSMKS